MLEKRICEYCGKEYFVDIELGIWQKDGTQKKSTPVGVSSKKFCCYECGKASRGKKITNIWKNKSKSEVKDIVKRRKSTIKPCKCTVCGKEFMPEQVGGSKDVHICSDECRKKRFRKIPTTGLRRCQNCGKEYMYIENQGSWNKSNELISANGLGHEFVVKSQRFCCYECGVAYKERKRNVTNIVKYGRISPFQDEDFRKALFEKQKKEGKLFTSKGEKEIIEWLESYGIKSEKYIVGNGLSNNSPRIEIDIYIPDKKIGIEYNGTYYHCMNGIKKNRMTKEYHFDKTCLAKGNGISLIHIWEDQWINQKDIIKGLILDRLSLINSKNIISGNECELCELGISTYKEFCKKYHINGYRNASIRLGLMYKNQLVEVVSFNKIKDKNNYELIRDCILPGFSVEEGFKRLLKYFVYKYKVSNIIYNIDLNIFDIAKYELEGFKVIDYNGPNQFCIKADHSYTRLKINPNKYSMFKDAIEQNKLWLCYGAGTLKLQWSI